jgi:hypothetical protein
VVRSAIAKRKTDIRSFVLRVPVQRCPPSANSETSKMWQLRKDAIFSRPRENKIPDHESPRYQPGEPS